MAEISDGRLQALRDVVAAAEARGAFTVDIAPQDLRDLVGAVEMIQRGNGAVMAQAIARVGPEPTLVEHEPAPAANAFEPIWPKVIADMQERHKVGVERYGTPLQPFNGRRSPVDLYQELLDAAVYTRQWIEERKAMVLLIRNMREALASRGGSALVGWADRLLRSIGEVER